MENNTGGLVNLQNETISISNSGQDDEEEFIQTFNTNVVTASNETFENSEHNINCKNEANTMSTGNQITDIQLKDVTTSHFKEKSSELKDDFSTEYCSFVNDINDSSTNLDSVEIEETTKTTAFNNDSKLFVEVVEKCDIQNSTSEESDNLKILGYEESNPVSRFISSADSTFLVDTIDSPDVTRDKEEPAVDCDDDSNQDEIRDDESKDGKVLDWRSLHKKRKMAQERPRGSGGKFRKDQPDVSVLDEDTRMDPLDEDSQSSFNSSKKEVRRYRLETVVPESTEVFTAEKLVEYVWPLDGFGDHYFLQEQISQYLKIMSFKRKYPSLRRRQIEKNEREYLKELGAVTEIACDLGLTAVRSEDVLDILFSDFPDKYDELQRILRERKENQFKESGKVEYQAANIDKSKINEYSKKASQNAAVWNAMFNKERGDERRFCFDLQTFTLHRPQFLKKKTADVQIGSYPVAVLPGQFTDHYNAYSSETLRMLPLNTVIGNTVKDENDDIEGFESDDEIAVPNIEIQDDKVETATSIVETDETNLARCKVCSGTKQNNKHGKPEPLIHCASCSSASHPTCIDLTIAMVAKIEGYNWQCMDCKTCVQCNDPDDEDKMIFCDMCDRGFHIYCVGLRRVPQGRWHCKECSVCCSCGSLTPNGNETIKNAEWQHEFKKDKNDKQLRWATTLCVPCDRYWKRRQYCYTCQRVYRSIPEDGMVRCITCSKYIHRDDCSIMHNADRYCSECFKTRNSNALNHSRIIAAAKKKMASGY